jgi:hypothetical protein
MVYNPNSKAVSAKTTRFSSIGNGGGLTGPLGAGGLGPANPLMVSSKKIAVVKALLVKIFMFL